MSKIVVALEGPAGAGKSTLINSLHDRGLMMSGEILKDSLSLPVIPRPRDYQGLEGINLALLKDQISALAVANYRGTIPLVLDRYYISAWIYNSIRAGYRSQSLHRAIKQALFLAYNELVDTSTNLRNRMELTWANPQDVMLHYVFLLPELQLLYKNRQEAGRPFPYMATQELEVYLEAVADFMEMSSNAAAVGWLGQNITYQVLTPQTQEDLAALPDAVCQGLAYCLTTEEKVYVTK